MTEKYRRKGLWIKHGFKPNFVNAFEELYKKYGEEIYAIQGIANSKMDIVHFSKEFFETPVKSGRSVADVSVDDNANVQEKSVIQYNYENNKALMRLNSLYLMFIHVEKIYGEEDAKVALEKVISGEIFVNDLSGFHMPYCYAFDLNNLITDGMNFFKGNMKIKAPKRSETFIALMIQTTAYISNQIMGAASFPSFFPVLDWFYRKDFGESYSQSLLRARKVLKSEDWQEKATTDDYEAVQLWNTIKNQFQNLIYSLNFPFRGNQSPFTNLSVLDRGFMDGLFKGYTLPDMTTPDFESTLDISKIFFEYYTEINGTEGMFTFPVMTLAASLNEKNEYLDPDFIDWVSEVNSEKGLANVFMDLPTSFSSCCRLRNDFSKIAESGYHNSFGVGGLSIGSLRVCGLNLPRMAYLEKDNPGILQENLDVIHKILRAQRTLIKEEIAGGYLPLYQANWININRQYSTVGFLGGYEYLMNKGMTLKQGVKALKSLLKEVEETMSGWQEDEKEEQNMYNLEQIPAESMAVRLAKIDYILGYNNKTEETTFSGHTDDTEMKWYIYSNQYIPLINNSPIYTRFKIQGELDQHTSGGAILHLNVDDNKNLSKTQFRRLIETARETGTKYFAINYAFSKCTNSHYTIGQPEKCPICDAEIDEIFTRVVGFVTSTKNWNKVRREEEFPERVFYSSKVIDKM